METEINTTSADELEQVFFKNCHKIYEAVKRLTEATINDFLTRNDRLDEDKCFILNESLDLWTTAGCDTLMFSQASLTIGYNIDLGEALDYWEYRRGCGWPKQFKSKLYHIFKPRVHTVDWLDVIISYFIIDGKFIVYIEITVNEYLRAATPPIALHITRESVYDVLVRATDLIREIGENPSIEDVERLYDIWYGIKRSVFVFATNYTSTIDRIIRCECVIITNDVQAVIISVDEEYNLVWNTSTIETHNNEDIIIRSRYIKQNTRHITKEISNALILLMSGNEYDEHEYDVRDKQVRDINYYLTKISPYVEDFRISP